MLGELFLDDVSTEERRHDPIDTDLFPEERALVAAAVVGRRAEFATVRGCARQALARFGCRPAPILHGARGEPMWPAGFVGAMTHCAGFRGCAVARSSTHLSIGVDCEPNEPLPIGVVDDVLLPEERRQVGRLRELDSAVAWDRLLFCAKEATYKVWFPVAGQWLDFHEAMVEVDPTGGRVHVDLVGPALNTGRGPVTALEGRWRVDGEIVGVGLELLST